MLDRKNASERVCGGRARPAGRRGPPYRADRPAPHRTRPAGSRSAKRMASPRCTVVGSSAPRALMFSCSALSDGGFSSTKVTDAAPRGQAPPARAPRCRRRGRAPGRRPELVTEDAHPGLAHPVGGGTNPGILRHDQPSPAELPARRFSRSGRSGSGCGRTERRKYRICVLRPSRLSRLLREWGDKAHSRACSVIIPFHSLHSIRNAASTRSSPSQGTRSAH